MKAKGAKNKVDVEKTKKEMEAKKEQGKKLQEWMNWMIKSIHWGNDYAVVIFNIEFFILMQWLAKPAPVDSEVE